MNDSLTERLSELDTNRLDVPLKAFLNESGNIIKTNIENSAAKTITIGSKNSSKVNDENALPNKSLENVANTSKDIEKKSLPQTNLEESCAYITEDVRMLQDFFDNGHGSRTKAEKLQKEIKIRSIFERCNAKAKILKMYYDQYHGPSTEIEIKQKNMYAEAIKYSNEQKYDEANKVFAEILKINPVCIFVHINKGFVMRKMTMTAVDCGGGERREMITMEPGEGQSSAQSLVEVHRCYDSAIKVTSQIYLELAKDFDVFSTFIRYKEALLMGFDPCKPYFNNGNLYGYQEDYKQAARYFGLSLKFNPEHADSMTNLGYAFYRMQRRDEAINLHRKAISTDPSCQYAYFHFGEVMENDGDENEAAKYYRKALEVNPNYIKAADKLYALGRGEQYGEYIEALIQNNPSTVEFQVRKAVWLFNQGCHKDARSVCLSAINAKDDLPSAHLWMGIIKKELKENDAFAHIDKAKQLYSKYDTLFKEQLKYITSKEKQSKILDQMMTVELVTDDANKDDVDALPQSDLNVSDISESSAIQDITEDNTQNLPSIDEALKGFSNTGMSNENQSKPDGPDDNAIIKEESSNDLDGYHQSWILN